MTKQDIIDYIMQSPWNTNPAVLSGMLEAYAKGDNKEEIELEATENKVYTPDEGKVYKKATVNVPGPTLIELNIDDVTVTEYVAPEGYAYNKVTIGK